MNVLVKLIIDCFVSLISEIAFSEKVKYFRKVIKI